LRLKKEEIESILKGLAEIEFLNPHFELYLFGSRADANKLGGDIDLLLVVSGDQYELLSKLKHRLVAQAKKFIDDQRIDLTIRSKESLQSDPFYKSIQNELVRIK
jgi:predicted nucleotidyltransferase